MAVPRYIDVTITGVAVVIVVAALIIVPFEFFELHHESSTILPPSSIHIGLVSNSQVNNTSGQNLSERSGVSSIFAGQSTQKPVSADVAYFVNSVGNAQIVIGSFEFESQSSASLFVLQVYQNAILDLQGYQQGYGGSTVNVVNGSFANFHFTVVTVGAFGNYSGSGSMVLVVVGSSGQFAFVIDVHHLSVSTPIDLIHDEISAMTN